MRTSGRERASRLQCCTSRQPRAMILCTERAFCCGAARRFAGFYLTRRRLVPIAPEWSENACGWSAATLAEDLWGVRRTLLLPPSPPLRKQRVGRAEPSDNASLTPGVPRVRQQNRLLRLRGSPGSPPRQRSVRRRPRGTRQSCRRRRARPRFGIAACSRPCDFEGHIVVVERETLEVCTHLWQSDEDRTREVIETASAGWLTGTS